MCHTFMGVLVRKKDEFVALKMWTWPYFRFRRHEMCNCARNIMGNDWQKMANVLSKQPQYFFFLRAATEKKPEVNSIALDPKIIEQKHENVHVRKFAGLSRKTIDAFIPSILESSTKHSLDTCQLYTQSRHRFWPRNLSAERTKKIRIIRATC